MTPSAKETRAAKSAKTPAATRENGRYTAPIPRTQRHSPPWYPFVIVGLLVLGLITIIANYAHVTPGGTHSYYLLVGIGAIVVGLIMATYYR